MHLLCVCVAVCVHIYIYTYIYTHTHIHMYTHVLYYWITLCIHMCVCISMYWICMYISHVDWFCFNLIHKMNTIHMYIIYIYTYIHARGTIYEFIHIHVYCKASHIYLLIYLSIYISIHLSNLVYPNLILSSLVRSTEFSLVHSSTV